MESTRTYLWDFFGPHATRTAEHFQRHLDEFLKKNDCPGQTALESEGEGHQAVSCVVSSEWCERIERALRPKRWR
ncbi:MAG TPA: hypothetical protein VM686_00945 [Polyangiaceae bacterium]|jgi:hypothetical protein|nr:hypothetical protein [Polyangiaceae bacterium]